MTNNSTYQNRLLKLQLSIKYDSILILNWSLI